MERMELCVERTWFALERIVVRLEVSGRTWCLSGFEYSTHLLGDFWQWPTDDWRRVGKESLLSAGVTQQKCGAMSPLVSSFLTSRQFLFHCMPIGWLAGGGLSAAD